MTTWGEPISPEAAIAIVQRTAAAKSRHDIATAASTYHPDALLECPTLGTRSEAGAIREALERWFAFAPDYTVDLSGFALDDMTLCGWGRIAFTPAFTATHRAPNGQRAETDVFILFQFKDGRIVWERFHFDLASIARQCGFATTDLVAA